MRFYLLAAFCLMSAFIAAADIRLSSQQQTNEALEDAAENNDEKAVRELLAIGADPNVAVGIAASEGHVNILRILAEPRKHGKEIDYNATSYDHAGRSPLLLAVQGGSLDAVQFLIKHGANPNIPSSRELQTYPLIEAAFDGRLSLVQELLKHHADPNLADAAKSTALTSVTKFTEEEGAYEPIVRALLNKEADIDHQNSAGDTALIIAARDDAPDIVRLLLARGANQHIKNNAGHNAIEVANRKIEQIIRNNQSMQTVEKAWQQGGHPLFNKLPAEVIYLMREYVMTSGYFASTIQNAATMKKE